MCNSTSNASQQTRVRLIPSPLGSKSSPGSGKSAAVDNSVQDSFVNPLQPNTTVVIPENKSALAKYTKVSELGNGLSSKVDKYRTASGDKTASREVAIKEMEAAFF